MKRALRIGAAAVGAVLFGALSSASNVSPSFLTYVLNAGWAWAAVLVIAGTARGLWFINAPVAGGAAALSYYLSDSFFRGEDFALYLPELGYWLGVCIVLGIVLGGIGRLARRADTVGLLARLVVPVGALVEMLWLPRWHFVSDPLLLMARIVTIGGALVVSLLFTVRQKYERKQRIREVAKQERERPSTRAPNE